VAKSQNLIVPKVVKISTTCSLTTLRVRLPTCIFSGFGDGDRFLFAAAALLADVDLATKVIVRKKLTQVKLIIF